MAVRLSKEALAKGEPIPRKKTPTKGWFKHEYAALDSLVGTTHALEERTCPWNSKIIYQGGTLTLGEIIYKCDLTYNFVGTFVVDSIPHNVVVKVGIVLAGVRGYGYSYSPRVSHSGAEHSRVSKAEGAIVKCYGMWYSGSFAFYVTERYPRDLHSIIHSSPPKASQIREWGRKILELLRILHLQGEHIHNDIKPSNIVVSDSGELRLIDFELCEMSYLIGSPFTPAIGKCGTRKYMSIQAHRPRLQPTGYKSDIESLVFMLEELFSGEEGLPWGDIGIEEEVYQLKVNFIPRYRSTRRMWKHIQPLGCRDIPDYNLLASYLKK